MALQRDLCRAGIIGALIGSTAGKAFDRWKLLFLFALVMVVVCVLVLRGRKAGGDPGAECNRKNAPKVGRSDSAPDCSRAFSGSAAAS